jgi:hypothetical protein
MPTLAIDTGFITDLAQLEKPAAGVFAKLDVAVFAQTAGGFVPNEKPSDHD